MSLSRIIPPRPANTFSATISGNRHRTVDSPPSPAQFPTVSLSALRARFIAFTITLTVLVNALTAASPSVAEAEAMFNERRYAEAQPIFEAVLETDPQNPRALLHLGQLANKRGDRALAVKYLAKAVAIAPDHAELQFEYGAASSLYAGSLGMSFAALGAARRGRDAMQKAVALAPSNLMFRQGLLEFYAGAPSLVGGGMKQAHAQAEAIAALDPNQGAFAHANLHRAEGDHPAALSSLASILERDPDNYIALFQFGRVAAESGLELERGLQNLHRCLELPAPDKGASLASVWWRIGQTLSRLGNLPAAREALEQAQSLAPHDARITKEIADLPPPSP